MAVVARIEEQSYTLTTTGNGSAQQATLDGSSYSINWQFVGARSGSASASSEHARQFSLLVGEQSYDVFVRPLPPDPDDAGSQQVEVMLNGLPYVVSLQDERARALASLSKGAHISGDAAIRAPMPGLVSNVMAVEGEEVEKGQTVLVLEAMKMENDLASPRSGHVKSVRVTKGQTVNQGDVLAVIGDTESTATPDDDDDALIEGQ